MRAAGLPMNDVWAHRVLREQGVQADGHDNVPSMISVMVERIDIEHHGAEQNWRPYLHISGELRGITPETPEDETGLPYDIERVTYSDGEQCIDAYYEFDDEQLSVLVGKGYFNPGFAVPHEISGIEWEFPATCDLLVLGPSSGNDGQDQPVVFTRVHDAGNLVTGLEHSGYDLTDYFADQRSEQAPGAERTREVEQVEQVVEPQASLDEGMLFDTEALLADEPVEEAAHIDEQAEQPTGLAAQVRAVDAELGRLAEQARAERENAEGTVEHEYREVVERTSRRDAQRVTGLRPASGVPVAGAGPDDVDVEQDRGDEPQPGD